MRWPTILLLHQQCTVSRVENLRQMAYSGLHSRLYLCLFDYLRQNMFRFLIDTKLVDKLIITLLLFFVDISHNKTTMNGIFKT